MIVEINLLKSRYKIECNDNEKNKIITNAQKLDLKLNKLKQALGDVDEKTLLVLCSLMIIEELNNANSKKNIASSPKNSEFSEDDIYDAISENIDNINNYIEKLISKIQDY